MTKISVNDIVAAARELYGKDKKASERITTGISLKRPEKPEEFILAPKDSPWKDVTGLMGIPYNTIVQIAGAYDSGKSSWAGEFMAEAQKQGVYVILLDTEKKFDRYRYENYFKGVADELMVIQSTIIREGVGAAIKVIKTIKEHDKAAKIFLVHDSVGGSVSRARAEKSFDDEGESAMASEARENSDYMRHITALISKYPDSLALLLINQMTQKIGFMAKGKSRSGGEKISFHSSLILEMNQIKVLTKQVKGKEVKTGIVSKVKVAKNHLSQTENSVHSANVMVTIEGVRSTDFSYDE